MNLKDALASGARLRVQKGPQAVPRPQGKARVSNPCQADRTIINSGLRVVSEANQREHWAAKARRVKSQRQAINATCFWLNGRGKPKRITLTRIEPRRLDKQDNLRVAFKATADELAAILDFNDGDESVAWDYRQRKPGKCELRGIEIQIEW